VARAVVVTQPISRTGVVPALTAPTADGDAIEAGTWLHVANAGGAPITVTIVSTTDIDGLPLADQVVTVPDGVAKLIGPFGRSTFAQKSGDTAGLVHVDYSSVTGVTRAAFSL
jgi:hypothetical protein